MKKINIGIVLIILSIILYFVCMTYKDKSDKKEIENAKEFAMEFIELSYKYNLLPEKFRNIENQMDEEEYKAYVEEMRETLGKYILDEQKEYLLEQYENVLEEQYRGRIMYYEYYPQGVKEKVSRVFDDNVIFLSFDMKYKIKADKRETDLIDRETGRYFGNIKQAEGITHTMPSVMYIKKMDDGSYKVLFFIKLGSGVYEFTFE